MIASGLLNFRRCCAFRMEGKSQIGIILICVSSEGRIMPYCNISSRLPTSGCASRHAPCVPCWVTFRNTNGNVPVNNDFGLTGCSLTACVRCLLVSLRLAFTSCVTALFLLGLF